MIAVWFLSSFPAPPAGATEPAINYSIAGRLGHWLQPLLAPIGFNWQMTVALIPGFAAREVAVAALGTVYAIGRPTRAGALATTLAHHWSVATACRSWPGTSSPRSAPRRWGGEARDQQLALADGHAGLHDRARLPRLADRLSRCGGGRAGLN
jgi:hypothetical protein